MEYLGSGSEGLGEKRRLEDFPRDEDKDMKGQNWERKEGGEKSRGNETEREAWEREMLRMMRDLRKESEIGKREREEDRRRREEESRDMQEILRRMEQEQQALREDIRKNNIELERRIGDERLQRLEAEKRLEEKVESLSKKIEQKENRQGDYKQKVDEKEWEIWKRKMEAEERSRIRNNIIIRGLKTRNKRDTEEWLSNTLRLKTEVKRWWRIGGKKT